MALKHLIAGVTLAALATPAVAADFYVVQDSSSKRCTIVEQKPTTTTTVVVGNGTYTSRTEAESAMKSVEVCGSGMSTGSTSTTTTTTTTK
jgi:vancomycin permeability regulator SanA